MRILYVTTISNTVNAFLVPHIQMLIESGHHVDIACNITQPLKEKLKDLGCDVFDIGFQRSPLTLANLKAFIKIKKYIEDGKYDLVHTHTPISSFITRLACKKFNNIKMVYTVHGYHFYKGSSFMSWKVYYTLEKWLSKYTDCIITINEEDYTASIENKFKSKQITLMNGVGIDLNDFVPSTKKQKRELREIYGFKVNDFILICVAELNQNKHQGFLIEIAFYLKKIIPELKILLVGTGNGELQYKNLAKKLCVEDQIKFLGYRNDVSSLMKLSDIAVSASRREGLPVNVMEAMATGLPLVVSDCRGNRDLVKHNENGYIVAQNDKQKFSYYIEKLYNDKAMRRKFSLESLNQIQKYDLKNVLGKLKDVHSKIAT